jgi:hypothetical protein
VACRAVTFRVDRRNVLEPKEWIMSTFDVSVIARYLPEFERVLKRV